MESNPLEYKPDGNNTSGGTYPPQTPPPPSPESRYTFTIEGTIKSKGSLFSKKRTLHISIDVDKPLPCPCELTISTERDLRLVEENIVNHIRKGTTSEQFDIELSSFEGVMLKRKTLYVQVYPAKDTGVPINRFVNSSIEVII